MIKRILVVVSLAVTLAAVSFFYAKNTWACGTEHAEDTVVVDKEFPAI